jgi:UDP-N-acetylmuramoylalanine--D-glutamate ligase
MSAALFAKFSGIPIIAVTGSRGKSTTTALIHHTLARGTEGGTVHLGGNVRGVSNLQLFSLVSEDDLAVMELDSWQLQGFGDLNISPHIAVFTSFLPDHMDYYYRASERSKQAGLDASERAMIESEARGAAMEAYFDDKALIFKNQQPGDVFITTPDVFQHVEAYLSRHGHTLGQEVVLADGDAVPEDWQISIPGEHNRTNIALAIEALRATSLPDDLIREGIESFSALPGRLEFLGERKGVKVYNDNNATSPMATLAGLRAVSEGKNVVLIMGGSDKKLDMSPLTSALSQYAKEIILLPGTGTDTIRDMISSAIAVTSLREGVEAAFRVAENGDVILFSPAFASFGLFKNEYDRNDQFVELVKKEMQ